MAVNATLYGPPTTSAGSGAPTTATYITQTADATLSAEQAMGSLASGLVKNTTTTGVQSIATAGTEYATGLADSYYRALAISRLGLTAGDKTYGFFWEDFLQAASNTAPFGWQASTSGSGAHSYVVAGSKGGNIQATTGATANSFADAFATGRLVGAIGTDKWWIGFRMTVTTAVTAQTIASVGFYDAASKSVQAGVFGAGSAVNFQVQYDGSFAGTFASMGVAIDTSAHFFELYCKGDSKVYFRIDEGTEGSVTPAAASANSQYLYWETGNGTDAVTRTAQRDFISCLFPR